MTHLLCHWKKYHRKKKTRLISHEKKTRLRKSCVTMTDFMIKIYEITELSDVMYEECSKSSALISKANPKKKSVLKQPM